MLLVCAREQGGRIIGMKNSSEKWKIAKDKEVGAEKEGEPIYRAGGPEAQAYQPPSILPTYQQPSPATPFLTSSVSRKVWGSLLVLFPYTHHMCSVFWGWGELTLNSQKTIGCGFSTMNFQIFFLGRFPQKIVLLVFWKINTISLPSGGY